MTFFYVIHYPLNIKSIKNWKEKKFGYANLGMLKKTLNNLSFLHSEYWTSGKPGGKRSRSKSWLDNVIKLHELLLKKVDFSTPA